MTGRMTRWVERRGRTVRFGNIVGAFVGREVVYRLPDEKTARMFEGIVAMTDGRGCPVAVPPGYERYRRTP